MSWYGQERDGPHRPAVVAEYLGFIQHHAAVTHRLEIEDLYSRSELTYDLFIVLLKFPSL
jgi:hypothetical protein